MPHLRTPFFGKRERKMPSLHWPQAETLPAPPWPMPSVAVALGRGLRGRCPACGEGRLFCGYLKIVPACAACSAPLGLLRADDAPPYFTILLVGHIIIPAMLILQRMSDPPTWEMSAIFLPLTLVLALGFLRPIKGGTAGVMLATGMLKPTPVPG